MLTKLDADVSSMQQGLQPHNLLEWYTTITKQAKSYAPSHLQNKIHVTQDPILLMKFNLDISKRAVKYFMMAIDDHLEDMPYTTKLYFLRVQQTLLLQTDKSLV